MENLKVEEFRGDGKFASPESVVPKSMRLRRRRNVSSTLDGPRRAAE